MCAKCQKIYKSKGGLLRHSRNKHTKKQNEDVEIFTQDALNTIIKEVHEKHCKK